MNIKERIAALQAQKLQRKLEGLNAQLEYLNSLATRHLGWAGNDDSEIAGVHREIADLFQQTSKQYVRLLALYG